VADGVPEEAPDNDDDADDLDDDLDEEDLELGVGLKSIVYVVDVLSHVLIV